MTLKHFAIAGLLVAALASATRPSPSPAPTPPPPDGISLRGAFTGGTAASDAMTVEALCLELADCIEFDGTLPAPRLTTGVAFDDLRVASRELRCRGDSIGARQPEARDRIKAYLDEEVGTSGGPVTPEQRAKWVSAFRAIGRAAGDATR